MWPFDDPKHQIGTNTRVPKVGPAPLADPRDLKIQELEQRLFGLECAIIEVCQVVKQTSDNTNHNFKAMEECFTNLIRYVMTPRVSIMGEQKEKN